MKTGYLLAITAVFAWPALAQNNAADSPANTLGGTPFPPPTEADLYDRAPPPPSAAELYGTRRGSPPRDQTDIVGTVTAINQPPPEPGSEEEGDILESEGLTRGAGGAR